MSADTRRNLPSVSALLESDAAKSLLAFTPRSVVVDAIRRVVDTARIAPAETPADDRAWDAAIRAEVARASRPSLRRVVNGTGVVLHTNLGRAPLANAAIEAMTAVARGFSNLEYDLDVGARGSRYVHCTALLRELTGAEDALVVNNCAAALVLVLDTLAHGRDAIVSRGELIEIGGSFRIPEIMEKSGARLVEVGTTNRTHLDDYRRALTAESGIVVKVHRSNFAIAGYVAEASAAELASFARERGLPLLHDLGSGLLIPLHQLGLSGEPTAADAIRSGATIVTMSADKLLGGPQAGLILGPRALLERIRKNPLTRSYRVDKLTLAALEATLALYRDPQIALREVPVLAQLAASLDALRARAERIVRAIDAPIARSVVVADSEASVGGGAFPTTKIPSVALVLDGSSTAIERRLRANDPPVVARIVDDRVLIDLRTVFPVDESPLIEAIRAALDVATGNSIRGIDRSEAT
jgi:L-seryl-tRNA(Ser) seleniumtransferase